MDRAASSRSELAGLDLWPLSSTMTKISYAGYRFPPLIIQQAIWLYLRFSFELPRRRRFVGGTRNRSLL